MIKHIWIAGTFGIGMILCIFGNVAFAVVGVVLGLATVGVGVFFVSGIKKDGVFGGFLDLGAGKGANGILKLLATLGASKGGGIFIGALLMILGFLLIILCIFVESVAFFLGGIITLAAGIILLPLCSRHHRFVLPFCLCCMAVGAFMLFAPGFIWWISVAMGVGLVLFSGVLLISVK